MLEDSNQRLQPRPTTRSKKGINPLFEHDGLFQPVNLTVALSRHILKRLAVTSVLQRIDAGI